MYHAAFKGSASLIRRANCTYDPVDDIPFSECSNGIVHFMTLGNLPEPHPEHRGTCVEGTCFCRNGYTGISDWVNLDGLDCHEYDVNTKFWAAVGFIPTVLSFISSSRVIYTTYKNSDVNDQAFQAQLKKKPNLIAIYFVICNLPVTIMSVIKFMSPRIRMVDPSANPVFFIYAFLSLNAEWWGYSMLQRTICEPFIAGIHKQSDCKAMEMARRVTNVAKRVPIVDLILRTMLIIIPALYGAWSHNMSVTIVVFFFQRMYSSMKLVVFWAFYLRSIHLTISTLSFERSSSSGNTLGGKLINFKTNARVFIYIVATWLVIMTGFTINTVFLFNGGYWYGAFSVTFMGVRGIIAVAQGLSLEVLYLDLLPKLRACFSWCQDKSEAGNRAFRNPTFKRKLNLQTGTEMGDVFDDVEMMDNPLRESNEKRTRAEEGIIASDAGPVVRRNEIPTIL